MSLAVSGRARELAALTRAWSRSRTGEGGVLVLAGERGLGRKALLRHLEDLAADSVRVRVDADGGRINPRLVWQRVLWSLEAAGADGRPRPGMASTAAPGAAPTVRRPALVVIDQLPPCTIDVGETIERQLPELRRMPLLVVLGVAERMGEPALSWHRWALRHAVPFIDLKPLDDECIRELVAGELPGADDVAVSAVVDASLGNPGVALEFCGWETGARAELPAPTVRELQAVAPRLTERVAWTEADDVLAVLAAARGPGTTDLIADVLPRPRFDVVFGLVRARTAGLVRESGDEFTLVHPLIGVVATALVGTARMTAIHAEFVRLLSATSDGEPGPDSVALAEHRLAAGESGPDVLRSCLHAAEWEWRQGNVQAAGAWAQTGLTMQPRGSVEARLLHLRGLSAVHSGAVAPGSAYLAAALEISARSSGGEIGAAITLDLLAAGTPARVFDPATLPLVRRALARCPITEPGLRARLLAHLAEASHWQDPARHADHAEAAVTLARLSGDPEILAQALLATQLAPSLHRPGPDEAELAALAEHSTTAGTALRLTRAHAALTTGDRSMLEALRRLDRPAPPGDRGVLHAALPDAWSDWWEVSSANLDLAAALLDDDQSRFTRALTELTSRLPSHAGLIPALPGSTRWSGIHVEPGLPVWQTLASGEVPPWFAALVHAGGVVLAAGQRTAASTQALRDAAPGLPHPADVARDSAWSTWMVILARAAVLLGDRDLCHEAADALHPLADRFAVLGPTTPIGPIGWYAAEALAALARADEALAVNEQARLTSARLGSELWVRRCLKQEARLRRATEVPTGLPRRAADAAPVAPGRGLKADDLAMLGYISRGMTNGAIARELAISVSTVERRLSALYRKLGVRNRTQAANSARSLLG